MKCPKYLSRGFTVVEILIASAIMAVLVTVILAITSQVLTSWNQASNTLSRNFESRVSLDLLVQDLEAALFRSDGSTWMMTDTRPASGSVPSDLPNVDYNRISFFTVAPDRPEGPGDVTAVMYFVSAQNPFGTSSPAGVTLNLYRAVVRGDTTFNDFLGALDLDEGRFLSGTGATQPYSATFLANNVIEFRIDFTLRARDASGTIHQGVVRTAEPYFTPSTPLTNRATPVADIRFPGQYNIPGAGSVRVSKPLYADVYIRIMDEEGLRMLAAGVVPTSGEERDNFLRRHTELFSRRVHFINNPI